ncbi:MFS transporter [Caulobacter sp. RL271]|jgi:OPA family sugar phosphate sensor protein UhpC-like MFS transporter|uniref:MFS transporter n=1 Tax=Caulobacter segnis TaxID=88688 RepID=A0ABY4ZYT8_9CAUL|nr:MFS transporter [Caulobacter segnis]USQ97967.1 MFS transporter [Caulobacter segnis]
MLTFFARGPDAPPLSDPATIDTLYRRHRFRIMLAITLGYGMSYTCRLALGMVKKPLIDAGIFTPTELGLIGSALFYAYAFGKLTNGVLADHANMKRFFAFSVLISGLANVGMGFSTTVALSAALWGINGWFQSFGAPAGVVSMSQWFSNRERGRYYGVWSTAHSIGEGLTFAAVGGVVAAFGWRYGFWGPAAIGVLVAIAGYFLIQDRPQTLGLPAVADWRNDHWQGDKPQSGPKPEPASVFRTQLQILKIPAVWALALSSALIYVTRYAINSWGVLYLQEARGYSLAAAGSMLMISTLAGIVGAISFGFVSDKVFGARRPPANLLFGLLELAGLALILYGPNTAPVMIIGMILFGLGMTALVTSLGGLFATDICPKRVAGAAVGLIGVFSYLGAAIQEHVSGVLIERGMRVIDGVRHYDFGPAMIFWMGASVASLTLAAGLWRTKLRD